jgi:hypothetical protein
MLCAIERLRFAIRTLPGILSRFSEIESEQQPAPQRWSKKEVLGHLIDSASNNHQRFVRGQIASGQHFPGYEQEQWVRIQGYVFDSCGEEIVLPIDLSAGTEQEYVEDCPVCCCPNLIHIKIDEDGDVRLWAERE